MHLLDRKRRLCCWVAVLLLGVVVLIGTVPLFTKFVLFQMPGRSATFDCDDSALLMYSRFGALGIEAVPIIGNLKMTGETPQEIDHVWLLVRLGGLQMAFDWGMPYLDRQHYEGFPVSYSQLVTYVMNDLDRAAAGIPTR
ncbi:MAG: hypothetical protein HYX96_00115 [Chloroflexi bacterium]|nr:hypothetical protein [Chloroflexota bacterium]